MHACIRLRFGSCVGLACMHTAPVRLGHRRHSGGKSADGEALALARGAGNRAAARDSVLTSQSGLVSDVCGPHGGALGSMAKGNRRSFREPEQ